MHSEPFGTAVNCEKEASTTFHQHGNCLVDYLLEGQDYLLFLDEELHILEANEAFTREIDSSWAESGRSFAETLSPGSRDELRGLLSDGKMDGRRVQLVHVVKGGTRSVIYFFRARDGHWLVVGRDCSNQLELVNQMAVLVEELEARISSEKERSQALRLLAEKDHLTGLANRLQLERAFDACMERYRREGKVFSVVSMDIDHFKEVNDLYGHPTGDQVLERVARILEENTRDGDCTARMGGDEFMVLALDLELPQALEVGERLRAAVEKARMPQSVRGVTISVGISATQLLRADEGRDLKEAADRALYAAKTSGRNCVRTAE